jgi:phosphoglycerate kinase
VDALLLGGGILNTVLAARGVGVGRSLHEPGEVDATAALLARARARKVEVPLPIDVVVARAPDPTAEADVRPLGAVGADDMILDIGPETVAAWGPLCREAGTVLWNGPLGVFEHPQFADGTRGLAQAVAQSRGYTLVGGGDTLAALERFGLLGAMSYVSTGGGAFLTLLEGGRMPALEALAARGRSG